MFDKQVIQMIAEGIRDTLYMTLFSTIIGYVIVRRAASRHK